MLEVTHTFLLGSVSLSLSILNTVNYIALCSSSASAMYGLVHSVVLSIPRIFLMYFALSYSLLMFIDQGIADMDKGTAHMGRPQFPQIMVSAASNLAPSQWLCRYGSVKACRVSDMQPIRSPPWTRQSSSTHCLDWAPTWL